MPVFTPVTCVTQKVELWLMWTDLTSEEMLEVVCSQQH